MLREVVDRKCVDAFRCASARAGGINFQACAFNHSAISPSLELTVCERSGSDYRKTHLQIILFRDAIYIQRFTGEPKPIVVEMKARLHRGPWKSSRETTSMKAFILDRYGSADRVRAGDMPDPELREDDVLVQIHAAGVNPLDSKIRNGEFKLILPYRLPLILGHDVAGVVVRVGSRVRRFRPGDEVYARPADGRIGAFAEFSAIKEDDVAIKPQALSMEEAASIPLVGLTAWQALIERAGLHQGQRVLIHAGAGGVGTFAIQLAKHVGATVATTTSTANVDLVRSLGADIVIDYKKEDFSHVLRDYDVVLHSLDKVTLEKSLRVLKPGGQLISISGPPDAAFARNIGASWILRMIMGALSYGITVKAKRRQAHYSFLFMRANGGQLTEITSLIDDGIIRPVVDRVFPFASTKEAMAYVEAGRARGKVVVSLK
jgi:NADPH:quinone reductase-like Zn-dependent oxidoreductase